MLSMKQMGYVSIKHSIGEGIKKLQNNPGDIEYSTIEDRVNIVIITIHGASWVLNLWEESLFKLYKCLTTMHI